MKSNIYHSDPITGFGNVKEFEGYSLENTKFFEEEANSIWYLITMPESGILSFDIKTHDKEDDWDFVLFEYKTAFCKRIADKKIEPIRTNLSRSPFTGLKEEATQDFVGAGINDNYSNPVKAKKGDQFVLVVNNPKASGKKHSLILHLPEVKKTDTPKEENPEPERDGILFQLKVKDRATKEPVKASIIISDLQHKDIELESTSEFETELSRKNYDAYITISAKGYMLTSKEVQINKTKSNHEAIIYLEKIAAGQKVNLKNIQFYGNRADFLPSARSSLKALLTFMQENPNVKIEVEGHVNGPKQKNTKDYKQLSYNRAYAVKDYLMKDGIEKERIDFTGYGNSQMLYPEPKSEYQESANRRVEIKIISNGADSGH
ncbi:MAG: OmpA family protein [Flavobacteriales bacterium]|nr:OmpA family protein [Flavobacteriales bacterium]